MFTPVIRPIAEGEITRAVRGSRLGRPVAVTLTPDPRPKPARARPSGGAAFRQPGRARTKAAATARLEGRLATRLSLARRWCPKPR